MMIRILMLMITMLMIVPVLSSDDGGVLRVGVDTFPDCLNPVYAADETASAICNKIYDALFFFDGSGNLQNRLAEKAVMESKNDNFSVTVDLKKKILFSDGKELDADDIIETVNLLQNREFKYPYMSHVKLIRRVEKLNRYRVRFHFNGKIGAWKNLLTFKILNGGELRNASPEGFRHRRLSGTGPYRIQTVDRQSRILLKANPYYDGKQDIYPHIRYELVTYTQLAPLKLVAGELDVCELQPEIIDSYGNRELWRDKFRIVKYKKSGYTYLVFNLNNPQITANVRNHFYNVVYSDFTRSFLAGGGETVHSPFPILIPANEKQQQRMETKPLDNPLTLRVLCNSKSRLRKNYILFLGERLKEKSILLKPVFLEYNVFLDHIRKGKYDCAVSGFLLDIDYDMKEIFHSRAYFNYANFSDKEMDRLLEQGLKEPDQRKRRQLYQRAHHIWLQHLPLLPLFNLYYYQGVSRSIRMPEQTYQILGSGGDFLNNIRQWRMKK